jgi:hypothetical protein
MECLIMFLRASALSLVTMLTAATVPAIAQMQKPSGVPLYWVNNAPAELVSASFADPYGRLLVAEFAAVISESSDAACLQTKGIEKNQIAERARAILLRVGAQMLQLFAGTVDRPAFESRFAARMGVDANAELVRLRTDPDVQKFIEIGQPEEHARLAEYVVVQLDRYALISRIKLARSISMNHSDNPALIRADPTAKTRDLLDAFIANHKSPAFVRYRILIEAAQESLDRTISLEALRDLGPGQLMSGLDREFADLCVVHR